MSLSPPKLHLNEHLSPRLATQLRQYGFDVTSTVEMGLIEADDDEQLAYAASNQRAIVTFNHKDFAVRHIRYMEAGQEHWGIVLSTEETVDVLRRRILRLLNTLMAEELKNQIRWLNEFK
jgi:predicted nuclease of predicted toxin-antitoxin system